MNAPALTHLGRYRILRELGRGAMGVVYLAQDEALQRQVAIKTVALPEDPQEARELEARFRQEAKAAAGLNHPNTITIHDIGREGRLLFIAMEVLQGVELRDRLLAGALPLDEALDIAGQVASGLAAAHARGVVHRDIKPGNVMVLPGGLAKIMDFGIARMQSSELRTATGTMMGSPRYMSPEQVQGHPVDHRSDIFSLGSLLYEMVTGQAAFQAENLGVLLSAIQRAAPTPPTQLRPGLPVSVELVIARAMQKNPQARYPDAAEMARDLAQCRAALTRPRSPATSPAAVDVDLDTATLPGGAATQPAAGAAPAANGWPLAPGFDSSAAWQRLLEGQGGGATAAGPPGPLPPARRLWWIAYAAAALGAIALAVG